MKKFIKPHKKIYVIINAKSTLLLLKLYEKKWDEREGKKHKTRSTKNCWNNVLIFLQIKITENQWWHWN